MTYILQDITPWINKSKHFIDILKRQPKFQSKTYDSTKNNKEQFFCMFKLLQLHKLSDFSSLYEKLERRTTHAAMIPICPLLIPTPCGAYYFQNKKKKLKALTSTMKTSVW